jgi:hypothetical protein
VGDRDGHHERDGADQADRGPAVTDHQVDPPQSHGAAVRPGDCPLALQGAGSGEPEQRRDQGDGDEHGDGDGSGGAEAHGLHERHPGDQQRAERDDHRGPGEDNGGARGGDILAGGVLAAHALASEGAVARDDEQGVVDPHGEAEHRGEAGDGGAEVGQGAERRDPGQADPDADGGGEQGHAGGQQRAEGDGQDQQSGENADALGGAAALGLWRGVTTDPDLQPVRAGVRGGGGDDLALRVGQRGLRCDKPDVGVGDPPAGRHRARGERVADRGDGGVV